MEHEAFLEPQDNASIISDDGYRDASTRFDARRFFFCIFSLKFCSQLNASLLELPFLRLVKHTICNSVLGDSASRTEEECKISEVQNKEAFIIGYRTTFDALPCVYFAK